MSRVPGVDVVSVFAVCFGLIAFCSGWQLEGNSDLSSAVRATESCEERETSGLICMDCSVVGTCVRIDDKWKTIPVAECDNNAGMFCNVRQGGCSDLAGPCNSIGYKQNFICTSVGIFPDPYDCQKYHFCHESGSSLGAINNECAGRSAYNPATGQCSLDINSNVCLRDQYVCDHVGQKREWPGNDNIFYICTMAATGNGTSHLYPAMYRCGAGEVFSGENCVQRSGGGGGGSGTEGGVSGYNCPSFGLFPVQGDCYSYYFCNNDLLALEYRCPEETYFDVTHRACLRGNCTGVL